MDCNEGYVSGIGYPATFFREQSPAHLSFACVLNGVEPISIDRPFTYLEIGCGQGLTANILAASNPQGQFYAIDFNPAHVAAARQLAEAARLDNLCVLENSLAQLASGELVLPPLDFITMYGVYSWVSEENRQRIAAVIDRYLKPGGIVYLNYNAMPGWAASLPLQRLMFEFSRRNSDARLQQVEQARRFIDDLAHVGAAYFDGNAGLDHQLNCLRKDQAGPIAHDYMDLGWQALYHVDVARDLAHAKLDFVGSADLSQTFPHYFLTPDQRALLETIGDRKLRETLKDYLKNVARREDIYVRGARPMSAARQEEWLQQTGLALTVSRGIASLDLRLPAGKIRADDNTYPALFDALAYRPHSLPELQKIPVLSNKSLKDLAEMAALLTASRQASTYFLSSALMSSAPALRMNRAVAQHARDDDHCQALASSLLGNGIDSGVVQRLIYRILASQPAARDAGVIAHQVHDIMRSRQQRLRTGGLSAESMEMGPTDSGDLGDLTQAVDAILKRRLPLWHGLKVL